MPRHPPCALTCFTLHGLHSSPAPERTGNKHNHKIARFTSVLFTASTTSKNTRKPKRPAGRRTAGSRTRNSASPPQQRPPACLFIQNQKQEHLSCGATGIRTPDPLLAKQVL